MDTFAERLHALNARSVDPATGAPPTRQAVLEGLAQRNVVVSGPYLSQLFAGTRDNPRFDVIRALADFYGVSLQYFALDDTETAASILQQLELLTLAKDKRFQGLMTRMSADHADQRDLVAAVLEALREARENNSDLEG